MAKRYWMVMLITMVVSGGLLLIVPKGASIPIYILALGIAVIVAIGLQAEAVRAARARSEVTENREDESRATKPQPYAKHA